MTRLLIVGATGLVGQVALAKALDDTRITRVVAPTRRALPAHPNLENPIVDFKALPEDAEWWAVDGVISALGTTRKATPSLSDYRDIDHGFTLAAARLALRHGAKRYALVSAMGANAKSPFFYPRLKGEIENDVMALGYPSITILRPGFIGGARKAFRAGEVGMARVLDLLAPILPRRFRVSPADRIATTLIEAALSAGPGRHVIEADVLAAD